MKIVERIGYVAAAAVRTSSPLNEAVPQRPVPVNVKADSLRCAAWGAGVGAVFGIAAYVPLADNAQVLSNLMMVGVFVIAGAPAGAFLLRR